MEGLILLKTPVPTVKELNECPILILTSDAPWNPNEDQGLTEIWDSDNTIEKEIQDRTARDAVASRVRDGKNVHICNVGTLDKVVTWTPDAFQDGRKNQSFQTNVTSSQQLPQDQLDHFPVVTILDPLRSHAVSSISMMTTPLIYPSTVANVTIVKGASLILMIGAIPMMIATVTMKVCLVF